MSSPGSNVDSAENLNRWRAIMTGTFGVPETPSPSSIESLPGKLSDLVALRLQLKYGRR